MALSRELRAFDEMNCSELWMRWVIMDHELRALDATSYSGQWIT